MNLEELNGRSVLLFGKTRAFAAEEFAARLASHGIALAEAFGDEVACIFEGAYIDPADELRLDALYAKKAAPVIGVEKLERALCETLDARRLMMSLKLSGDRKRLLGYLRNGYIDNELFLKLLPLYDWQGEGFFDNDENRDVSAALVSRFYANIARDPNVQYVHLGIMQLVAQSEDAQLIEAVAMLKPLQEGIKNGGDDALNALLCLIAEHPKTPVGIIRRFVQYGSDTLKALVAARADIDAALQQQLLALQNPAIDEALSQNSTIDPETAFSLLEREGENIAAYSTLSKELFEACPGRLGEALAINPTLTPAMQERLFWSGEAVQAALASNPSLEEAMIAKLYATALPATVSALAANPSTMPQLLEEMAQDEALHTLLGSNPNTPPKLLEKLALSDDVGVLSAVAQNRGASYDLLCHLLLDRRVENDVKQNPAFSRNTSRTHIGWMP